MRATQVASAPSSGGDRRLHDLPLTGYIRQAQLIPTFVPVSSSTLWRWIKAGKFPAPYRLGDNVSAWKVAEVREWLESREREAA